MTDKETSLLSSFEKMRNKAFGAQKRLNILQKEYKSLERLYNKEKGKVKELEKELQSLYKTMT